MTKMDEEEVEKLIQGNPHLKKYLEEIQKKMHAAREVSRHLLTGRVDPPTRYMFNITKEIVSKKFHISLLGDMEIIAYSRRKDRTKINRMIRELKKHHSLANARSKA